MPSLKVPGTEDPSQSPHISAQPHIVDMQLRIASMERSIAGDSCRQENHPVGLFFRSRLFGE
jgi:hypothetical protein